MPCATWGCRPWTSAGLLTDLGVPLITTDDEAVADLAVEHFLERGFRHFAFCGFPGADYSDDALRCFARSVEEAGFACHVYRPSGRPRRPGPRPGSSGAGRPRAR